MADMKYTLKTGGRFYCPKCGANKMRIKSKGIDEFECHACLTHITLKRSADGNSAVVSGKAVE